MSTHLFFLLLLATTNAFHIFPQLTFRGADRSQVQCDEFHKEYIDNLNNHTNWAVRLWESSAKQPSGWAAGNLVQLGSFDECLATAAPMPLKYCLTQLRIALPNQRIPQNTVWHQIQNPPDDGYNVDRSTIWMGYCLPAACMPSLDASTTDNPYNLTWNLTVLPPFCTEAHEDIPVDWSCVALMVFTGLLMLMALVAALMDKSSNDKDENVFIQSFSLKRNFKTLLAPLSNPQSPIAIAHGLKVSAIIVIIINHCFLLRYTRGTAHHENFEANSRNPIFQYLAQFDTVVDVFFFLSGLLVTYVVPANVNGIFVILARIFRLTPVCMYMVWMNASLMPYLGSGPLWKATQVDESRRCSKNWWVNLLFLQNYFREEEICNLATWYVAADFHCFLVGVVLLMTIRWRRSVGLTLTALVMVVAIIVPGVISYSMNLEPFFRFYIPEFLASPMTYPPFRKLYMKSHNRIAVYLVGFIGGLYFSANKDCSRKPNKQMATVYFLISLVILLVPMAYGMTMDAEHIRIQDAVYAAVRRPIWGVGLFMLLLANKEHPLIVVQPLLTCRLVAVLSRLTFGIFLFNYMLMKADYAAMRSPVFFSYYDIASTTFMIYFVVIAFLSYMFLEQPIKLFLLGLFISRRKLVAAIPTEDGSDTTPRITSVSL